jgi:hypothetical protein
MSQGFFWIVVPNYLSRHTNQIGRMEVLTLSWRWNRVRSKPGRGDLNARPPAPKAVSGGDRKWPILNCFCFKRMPRSCCAAWKALEPGGSRQLQFHLQRGSR